MHFSALLQKTTWWMNHVAAGVTQWWRTTVEVFSALTLFQRVTEGVGLTDGIGPNGETTVKCRTRRLFVRKCGFIHRDEQQFSQCDLIVTPWLNINVSNCNNAFQTGWEMTNESWVKGWTFVMVWSWSTFKKNVFFFMCSPLQRTLQSI